jgi:hypothetical protein
MPLKTKCACGTKTYRDLAAAERALTKVRNLGLREDMPKRVAQCWYGQWHLEGKKKVDTGPDADTRELVKQRDDWTCACCGNPIVGSNFSLQHRLARGGGGTSDPAINSPANLILLCGSATTGCHGLAESRDAAMHRLGFWLKHGQEPAKVRVAHAVHGWVRLLDNGDFEPAVGDAA